MLTGALLNILYSSCIISVAIFTADINGLTQPVHEYSRL
jgi:hypothetical protein